MINQENSEIKTLEQNEVIIIGAGPVGIYTAIRCALKGIRTIILEASEQIGGQCQTLYKEKLIYDLPGINEISGGDFANNLKVQADLLGIPIKINHKVIDLEKSVDNVFIITISNGEKFRAKYVVMALGGGCYSPIMLNAEGAANYSRYIKYSVDDLNSFKEQRIVLFGGGDTAIDWALALTKVAKKVTLVHRGNNFRGSEARVKDLAALQQEGLITILLNSTIIKLGGDEHNLRTVSLKTMESELNVDIDMALVFFGLKMDNVLTSYMIKPNLERGRILVNPITEESSIENLFAVGDISIYKNKKLNLTTGFGQSVQVAETLDIKNKKN